MEKITWTIKTINKQTQEPIEFEITTLGYHPEIARDKAIIQLARQYPDTNYYSDDLLITQKETQKIDIGTPYGGA
jgi:hypothetical protein